MGKQGKEQNLREVERKQLLQLAIYNPDFKELGGHSNLELWNELTSST